MKKHTATEATPVARLNTEQLKDNIVRHLHASLGTDVNKASPQAWWRATCAAINEQVFDGLRNTQRTHYEKNTRALHYFSLEYLMGRLFSNNLHNLGLYDQARQALGELGMNIADLEDQEEDMALGNGGLGRLAACFIDSLATLNYPAIGYGIHYEHGLFKQSFQDGRQIERPDSWREYGNPWEICRPESVQEISVYGYVETVYDLQGRMKKVWHPGRIIKGVPWDIPVVGYNGSSVNVLRLWESRASDFFNWDVFNSGGYIDAARENIEAETISKVLYPNDETDAGKELRLIQQYFFVSCSLKDIIRRYKRSHGDDWSDFAKQVVIQLNDTHPAVAIPELMRILVDRAEMQWDQAWNLCQQVFAYTNHTLLPEALEKWPVRLFEKVLPRHIEIIYEINRRFLVEQVDVLWPGDNQKKRKLSIIEEGHDPMVRMGHLSVVGSFRVNGVAEIHSTLVKSDLFPEMVALWPDKFTNVTNGVTPRRWLKACNPRLSALLDKQVGTNWPTDLKQLSKFAAFADDPAIQDAFMAIKQQNKAELASVVKKLTNIDIDPHAIFDIQIKRLHEYKRQHLNLLHILALYRRILQEPDYDMVPRVFLFGAKAAPGYKLAKEIIYAINKIADKINHDKRVKNRIKVVFMPNYRVTLAEKMIPAADVSEQISTAGKEASGTGNMKLALNGAVTVGTLDGANIEIAEEVGSDNIAIFGLTVDEVKALQAKGYNSSDYYYADPEIKAILDWLETDYFTPGKPGELAAIKRSLLEGGDPYLVLADFASYVKAQEKIDLWYRDKTLWAKKAMLNTASVGKFTSDRSIEDYVSRVWQLQKCAVNVK
ncbi:MAG: glycogen/starch/alpha-glucan phosphorylase [Gammaproteobacteria bacterium]|nr:glycogen/starch/alpha-glucan phosphorylase [Gammaproteobacteria bacterium]MBU1556570.1 glycogen/starch/alpha-glucan phosphorylase [Gammaproteobacteria bacterium]MBU2072610.1 glycogen/starch/alpha-glucan phosphorylase [Gammaproteobacteria bacterium]MBU2182256.1 glycogen/starch/alpha-glucan phosphorylase [Gammaproteobacteria bacterium]MBU2207164.1 glycogen/starch/alpha-glucan phosphorylase [Gammaproteobacteria bacterium]